MLRVVLNIDLRYITNVRTAHSQQFEKATLFKLTEHDLTCQCHLSTVANIRYLQFEFSNTNR